MDRQEAAKMMKASSGMARVVRMAVAGGLAVLAAMVVMAVPALAAEHAAEAADAAAAVAGVTDWVAIFKAISAAFAIGMTAFATALAQSRIGPAGAGAMAEKPEVSGTVFILVAIPETMVILGFVVAAMLVLF